MLIRIPRGWEFPERDATPESVYMNRRSLLAAAGFLGVEGLLAQAQSIYPAKRNADYPLDRPITDEGAATSYNNFYEFHPTDKAAVRNRVGKFKASPWKIEIGGQVAKPRTVDIDELFRTMPFEERLYRFRCVERWAMAVPWTGFPLAELVKLAGPKANAKFVRFVTAYRPGEMPGMTEANWYPWPYFEGLRMDEAMNPLAMVVTGVYGKPLPVQNGAPIRIITPWKYGYKSIKSIVKVEFVEKMPETFWHKVSATEYGFYSNVNPAKPHPRWSQAIEQLIPTGERVRTQMYNGYEKWVGQMYSGDPDRT